MRKRKIIFLALFLFLTVLIFFLVISQKNRNFVCFEKKCFDVELAKTSQEREVGLMFRKELKKNNGMLFVFETEDFYSFWMKNTFIPLDIIWINGSGEIVFISKNNEMCSENSCPLIQPDKKAKYVLEINSGIAEENKLFIGEKAIINLKK